ncbi:Z1 domain-containing protein [Arthrobacter zhaoguopingii]|uniref:Z1 domain-containing protein n=1 Tax=Arthrobacter zhaoguopingii TaxID=2681491 RepID=UPI00135CF373|nr:Z1 domain-containing protein [Arthrobacter zhaoguopingii]
MRVNEDLPPPPMKEQFKVLNKPGLKKMIEGHKLLGNSFNEAIDFYMEQVGAFPGVAELLAEMKREHEEGIEQYNAKNSGEVVDGKPAEDGGGWYDNNKDPGLVWGQIKQKMSAGPLADAVATIDKESGLIVKGLANPKVKGDKVRGLVIGYVQSGKTANYTAVVAKALDEGFRMVIVLAGMHNNLRQQTQERLDRDLFNTRASWYPLTDATGDIGTSLAGTQVLGKSNFYVTAVVKKNPSRLTNLVSFLKMARQQGALAKTPILIIDDESDQATPNTEAKKEKYSGINNLVRQVWELVETGSYVAYTATPFANIFMDPDDGGELYPANFIYPLSRPETYIGARKVFGVSGEFSEDGSDDGMGIVRYVPKEEVEIIVPKSPQAQEKTGEYYDPEMVPSLAAAVQWFVIASAVRRFRGHGDFHSSMLVHTAAWKDSHFALQAVLQEYVHELRETVAAGDCTRLEALYSTENTQIEPEGQANPAWDQIRPLVADVLADLEVLADNGASSYRVEYPDGRPRTVVVVGGNTLARGLTLEGLVTSYFVRGASAYDTLLQMGRWFGYRPDYADLLRIWTSAELAVDYAFLAGVEEELRDKVRQMAQAGSPPNEVGVAVRTHPGRLEITSRNKMTMTEKVTLALGGHRHQTTRFEEHDGDTLRSNQEKANELVQEALAGGITPIVDKLTGSVMLSEVPASLVAAFLSGYAVNPDHTPLQPERTVPWIEKHADRGWNVVLRASSNAESKSGGTYSYAHGADVPLTQRPPLLESGCAASANIKALMAGNDVLIDLQILERRASTAGGSKEQKTVEEQLKFRQLNGNVPLLVLYAIDKNSQADHYGKASKNRRNMDADEHIIGLGLVLPDAGHGDVEYVAVTPTLDDEDLDVVVDFVVEDDNEKDYVPAPPPEGGESL